MVIKLHLPGPVSFCPATHNLSHCLSIMCTPAPWGGAVDSEPRAWTRELYLTLKDRSWEGSTGNFRSEQCFRKEPGTPGSQEHLGARNTWEPGLVEHQTQGLRLVVCICVNKDKSLKEDRCATGHGWQLSQRHGGLTKQGKKSYF